MNSTLTIMLSSLLILFSWFTLFKGETLITIIGAFFMLCIAAYVIVYSDPYAS